MWDITSSCRVDYFLANSNYTAARIKKFYNRDCEVLFPPIDTDKFKHEIYGDYYLMISRLVGYKRFDLAIEAFNESGKNLVIIGEGTEFKKYKKMAKPNVKLLGNVSNKELYGYMNRCRGFIFPGKEDFGIVMAEAQAAGKPVIAFKGGGALDIVKDKETGILFEQQSVKSINDAVKLSESINWDNKLISAHAEKFDQKHFVRRLNYILNNAELFARKNLTTSHG
jgi:glycosyltransferase involved in cell wall biosynthesis